MSDALAVARALYCLHVGVCIPNYEKLLSQTYHRFMWQVSTPDIVIVDAGAHTGLHVDQFVHSIGRQARVIAFEPVPHLADALAERFPQVDVRQIALGRTTGTAAFYCHPEEPEMAGLRIRETRDGRAAAEPITVQVDTLDRQLAGLELLTYLKVDVEGGEIDCLLGGQQTIARLRPFISVEYGKPSYSAYGHTARTLFDLAAKMEYVPSDLFGNLIETEADWLAICDVAYWDYFLIPAERVSDWRHYFAQL